MADDHRTALYRHLHKQHAGNEAQRIYTANRVLQLVYDKLKVRSVLDVGCGRGLWLAVAGGLGAIETIGIEGPWIESETSYIALDRILMRDLELGFDLNRTFDLVMSIEVAEHLSPAAAKSFVTSLARHGDFILFSAAIPFQPGTGHVNCQFPDYWARLFSEHDYKPVDFIRPAIWNDSAIHLWIRQNMLAFVSAQFLSKNSWAREVAAASRPLSIVHPELFAARRKPRPTTLPQAQRPRAAALQAKLSQAIALHRQGHLADAERCYKDILQWQPDQFDALHLLGVIARQTRRTEWAVQLIKKAIGLKPRVADAHNNLGNALLDLKRPAEALASYATAIALKADFPEAHNNRGNALLDLKRPAEALASYHQAISLKRDYAEAHYNCGNALKDLQRPAEALSSYNTAIALKPDHARAYSNRGAALMDLKRFAEALASYEKAITLEPDFAEAYYNRGNLFWEYNRIDKALGDYQTAYEIRPDFFAAKAAACVAQLPILYDSETEVILRRAAYQKELHALCDIVEAKRAYGTLTTILESKQPFHLAYQGYNDRDLQRTYGSMACRILEYKYPEVPVMPLPEYDEKVKVGFVSAFFHLHSNWKVPIKGWLSQLDRKRFKIFGYHVGSVWDSETDFAEAMCDRFVHRAMTIDEWRREILNDAPHVLIFPGLLMDKISIQLAAQRLAPVQCNSWGHPDTSGMYTLDYYLSSDLMEPDDAVEHYTEKLIRLPNLSIYYEPMNVNPSTINRAELGLRSDSVVFWCGQSLYKYLPQFDQVFARIAQLAKTSQFIFVKHSGAEQITDFFRRRLQREFAALDLKESDYCVFLPHLTQGEFIDTLGQCDIFLDSIGWSGCNTSLESLSYNLPIVTMRGTLMRGRHSAAMLRMMGITETITNNVDEFVTTAARLANYPDERNELSRKIAANKHRLYRDRECIEALEEFLDRVARRL